MNKNIAIWLTCEMAKELERAGVPIPSGTCEAIERKLIIGDYKKVFTFFENRLLGKVEKK